MNKRTFFRGLTAILGLVVPVAVASAADRNRATWTVPRGINKIRIRSTGPDGRKIFSRELDVEPGQTFYVEAA